MRKSTARWRINLDTSCPYCGHEFDIFTLHDYVDIVTDLNYCESNEDVEVPCPRCHKSFIAITTY